jgi:hypothetical protein
MRLLRRISFCLFLIVCLIRERMMSRLGLHYTYGVGIMSYSFSFQEFIRPQRMASKPPPDFKAPIKSKPAIEIVAPGKALDGLSV